jgi:hypothetical protein
MPSTIAALVWNPTHLRARPCRISNWHLFALDNPRPERKMTMLGAGVFDFLRGRASTVSSSLRRAHEQS